MKGDAQTCGDLLFSTSSILSGSCKETSPATDFVKPQFVCCILVSSRYFKSYSLSAVGIPVVIAIATIRKSHPANMAPSRTMTGETITNEKTPQTPVSPTHTDTSTLQGDAIIEIREDNEPNTGLTSNACPVGAGEVAQPGR